MISFDEASARIAAAASPLEREKVALDSAHRRVLAAPVLSRRDSPAADSSAMDGFAVRSIDLEPLPARLRIVGESAPARGHGGAIGAGECVRILTGGPLPEGADRIVVQEIVRREGDVAVIETPPGPSAFVRRRGHDFLAGQLLVEAGRSLDPTALVAIAGGDVATIDVVRRPRLAMFTCGDELVAPGEAHGRPGAIPDSIAAGLAALAGTWGGEIALRERLPDRLETMVAAADRALGAADLLVIAGGASVGDRDFARAMLEPHGLALDFSRVAVRPGMPTWFGRARGTLVLGLPGNPSSAIAMARLFLAPLLCGLSGRPTADALAWRTARLATPIGECDRRETFARGRAVGDAVEILSNQDSSAQATLAAADLLVRRRPHAPVAWAGETVEVLTL